MRTPFGRAMSVRPRHVRLIACLLLLVLSATAMFAGGSTYYYGPFAQGPTSINPGQPVGIVGIGAVIDVSNIATSTNYVSGTCDVQQVTAPDSGTIGPFSYMCGADRDNDGFVTRFDMSNAALGHWNTGSPAGHDDDFAGTDVAAGNQGSVPICFRADVNSLVIVDGYPMYAIWDTFEVFIALNVASTAVAFGGFAITIQVADLNNGGCTPSSHGPDWI
jgi:hypothetical protein